LGLNTFQYLIITTGYKTLNQVQADKKDFLRDLNNHKKK